MSDDRLPTDVWVMAHVRRCSAEGIPVTVVHRGDGDRGTVLLKLFLQGRGCRLLSQSRDLDGRLGWLPALDGAVVDEGEADAYIARAVARDPDLWVIEIEERDGRHPFEGPML